MIEKTIPSYLYCEYNDDEDLQAFVDSYNNLTQQVVNWFNHINLPIYTSSTISGDLLNWVAKGLYGIDRPTLTGGLTVEEGPYNTYGFNVIRYDGETVIPPTNYAVANDDVFKRVITWHFYKGDGKTFNIRWLKRRIMRFLNGYGGTSPNVDQTYRVSVSFGLAKQVNITILNGVRSYLGGFNTAMFNTRRFNDTTSTFVAYPPLPLAQTFKTAVDNGILPLPFQYSYVVSVV